MEQVMNTTVNDETNTYEIVEKLNLQDQVSKNITPVDQDFLKIHCSLYKCLLVMIYGEQKAEEIERMLKKLSLRPPRDYLLLYYLDNYDRIEKNNDYETLTQEIYKLWYMLPVEEQSKYVEKEQKEKEAFNNDLLLVKNFLYFGYDALNGNEQKGKELIEIHRRIEMVLKGIYIPEDFLKVSKYEWPALPSDERKRYTDIMDKNQLIINKIKNNNLDESTKYFIYFQYYQSLEPNKKDEINNLYVNKFDHFETRIEILDYIYNLMNHKEMPEPLKPFQLFLQDLTFFGGKYKNISILDKLYLWKSLDSKLKEQYINKYKFLSLAYNYKKIIEAKIEIRKLKKEKNINFLNRKKQNDDIVKDVEKITGFKILTTEEKNNIINFKQFRKALYNDNEKDFPIGAPLDLRNFANSNKKLILKVDNDLGIDNWIFTAKMLFDYLQKN